jgi:hypothetical protein
VCSSCGCGRYSHRHKGSHSIVWEDIKDAAKDADISPETAAENMLSASIHMTEEEEAKKAEALVSCHVVKASAEARYTLGVAYPANRPDVGVAADGFQDFAGTDVLEKAAWSFMQKGGAIGLHHADGTEGHGTVVESYVYRGPDWDHDGYTVKSGDWLIGVVWDDETWPLVKSGRIRGFSPQGAARRRAPTPEALANLRN